MWIITTTWVRLVEMFFVHEIPKFPVALGSVDPENEVPPLVDSPNCPGEHVLDLTTPAYMSTLVVIHVLATSQPKSETLPELTFT